LTSTLSWTSALDASINVQVTAHNSDGTSLAATESSTIKYMFAP